MSFIRYHAIYRLCQYIPSMGMVLVGKGTVLENPTHGIPCSTLSMHGYFSPNIPGCFISDHKEGFLKGDIVVLGQDTCQKVVMEEIIEVGRHFILYKVREVGLIPMGGVWITQLVAVAVASPVSLVSATLDHLVVP